MGIRFSCPNGHKLNVKEHLAGKRGVCPSCGAKFAIPDANEVGRAVPAIAASEGGPSIAGSPSVVINVAEAFPPAPAPPPPPTTPQHAATSPPDVAVPPLDFSAIPSGQSVSPASTYATRRERIRKTQLRIAIALLLAVIGLAIVLIWVLRRGPTETPTASIHQTYLAYSPPQAYVAEAVRFA